MTVAEDEDWHPNQFLYLPGDEQTELRVTKVDGERATLLVVDDYRNSSHSVWGINARNREQNFALNALMDPEVDFVTLLGTAGTGKTLLALAAGLAQTMDQQRYRSEEHTSELQSLMRISYAVFCLNKKTCETKPPK